MKRIGVVDISHGPLREALLPPYLSSLERAGAEYEILEWTDDEEKTRSYADKCDGFLFTGGDDIDPSMYGEEKLGVCGDVCPQRDAFEKLLLTSVLETKKPVLGICRGIQSLNVMLGGTLWQDIPSQLSKDVKHSPDKVSDITEYMHEVKVSSPSLLDTLSEGGIIRVNSFHHQGIRELAKNLRCIAKADDGVTEAVQMDDHPFFLAVQWHPEHLSARYAEHQGIFDLFVKNC